MKPLHHDLQKETQYLSNTVKLIKKRISLITTVLLESTKDIKNSNKAMWDETSSTLDNFDVIIEFNQYMTEHNNLKRKHTFYKEQLAILEKIQLNPYFARIDFKHDNFDSIDKIYIGIATLMNDETEDIIIYDWRAPISGMFYDFSPGPVEYTSPSGQISGDMLLKRQFRIENSILKLFFNTDIKIDDEILQEILSHNSDNKMRDIVTSIQKEQNKIIRDEDNRVLVVQGPAGSGKTSIALHRAAYLMYKHRKTMTAENILIFSPNDLFTSYISDVLPSLGEKNPNTFSFHDFADDFIWNMYKVESPYDHMEYMFSSFAKNTLYAKNLSTKFKSSLDFKKILDNYIEMIDSKSLSFKDIKYNDIIAATKDEIKDIYYNTCKNMLFGEKRKHIRKRLLNIVERLKKDTARKLVAEFKANDKDQIESDMSHQRQALKRTRKSIESLENQIKSLTRYDLYELYIRLFEKKELFEKFSKDLNKNDDIQEIMNYTKSNFYNKFIPYEDLAPFLYFKSRLEKTTSKYNIRHLIIDEGQDFSTFYYEFLNSVFPRSSITILSDLNQSIHPFLNLGDYKSLVDVYGENESKLLTLKRSYRTTKEIVELTNNILKNQHSINDVARSGEKPEIKIFNKYDDMDSETLRVLGIFKNNEFTSAAIICKSAYECNNLYARIKDKTNIKLISKDSDKFDRGYIIIPSYLAKGLEFDGVIAYDVSNKRYPSENDRKLLYTICTRAKHELKIYGLKDISNLIHIEE